MTVFTIPRQQLRDAWRTRSLVALSLVLAMLAIGAAVAGKARFQEDVRQRSRYQALVAEQWNDQPDRHPHRVSHYGFLVFRPRAPLGFFDSGTESFTGSTVFLEAHRQNTANFSDAAQADGTTQFGELTLALVLQLLAPLLILTTAGLSIVREREAGTLALVLVQGVSWGTALTGKLLGSVAAVALMIVPAIAGAVVVLARDYDWTNDAMARAALLGGAHALYLMMCAALGIALCAGHTTSRAALVTLLGTWVALWVVLPRALPGLASALYPVPARSSFEAAVERRVRELGDSHNPNDPKFAALRDRYLTQYGVSRIEELPLNYNGVVSYEAEKLTTEAYREHLATLTRVYERQARLVLLAGILSPYVAMRTVSMTLAGVDISHANHFERSAEDYRFAIVQRLNELHSQEVTYALDRYGGGAENAAPTRQRIDRAHFQAIPVFTYTSPDVVWALNRSAPGLAVLTGWGIAMLAVIIMTARRPFRL